MTGTTLEKTDTSSGAVRGAGITNNGTLSIADSTVSGNTEVVTGRKASPRGGNLDSGGTVTIVNSTIFGNSQIATSGALTGGSAITNLGTELSLLNVTVAGNSGAPAIANFATLATRTSIFSNAPGGNCDGALTSQGANIESTDQCGLHAAGDQVGTDPLLGPLADNGGQTDTLALLPASPAIDRGTDCPPVDQRGVARPQGPACDIGAVELVPLIATPSNAFKFGRLKRNKARGTAILSAPSPARGRSRWPARGSSPNRPSRSPRRASSSSRSRPRAGPAASSTGSARPR